MAVDYGADKRQLDEGYARGALTGEDYRKKKAQVELLEAHSLGRISEEECKRKIAQIESGQITPEKALAAEEPAVEIPVEEMPAEAEPVVAEQIPVEPEYYAEEEPVAVEQVLVEPEYYAEEEPVAVEQVPVEPEYYVDEEPVVVEPEYYAEEEPAAVEPEYYAEEEPAAVEQVPAEPEYYIEEDLVAEEPEYYAEEEPDPEALRAILEEPAEEPVIGEAEPEPKVLVEPVEAAAEFAPIDPEMAAAPIEQEVAPELFDSSEPAPAPIEPDPAAAPDISAPELGASPDLTTRKGPGKFVAFWKNSLRNKIILIVIAAALIAGAVFAVWYASGNVDFEDTSTWPNNSLSKMIPEPKGEVSYASADDESLDAEIECTQEEYQNYLNQCKEKGFGMEVDSYEYDGETSVTLENREKYQLDLIYDTNEKLMYIYLATPDEEL